MNRWVTPLTVGLFVVSGVSGVALFFHLAGFVFHGMHEKLSVGFFVLALLHAWRNRAALLAYARGRMAVALLVALVPAAAMGTLAARRARGPTPNDALELMTQARFADLAPVLKTTPEEMRAKLEKRGFHAGPDDTLESVAKAAHVNPLRLLMDVTPR